MTLADTDLDFCKLGLAVIETEAASVQALGRRIDADFAKACRLLLACSGRIIVIGMGKSGHIGNKLAATFASTGSPAFFVHPAEASHGDMGMITPDDAVIALSYSGETTEVLMLLPVIKRIGVGVIAITGQAESSLAQAADVHLDVHVTQEACPLGLAPTSSTTATLVMGDALAIALLQARGFTPDDFARSHPGGSLGKRLLLQIDDVMQTGEAIARVNPSTTIGDALIEITRKRLGMTAIVDAADHIIGIYTDGDLRRSLAQAIDLHTTPIQDHMTTDCKTVQRGLLAAEALQLMQSHKITTLLVTDNQQHLIGVLHLHDLLRAGV